MKEQVAKGEKPPVLSDEQERAEVATMIGSPLYCAIMDKLMVWHIVRIQQARQEARQELFEEIEAKYMIKQSPNPDFLRNGLVILSPEQWQALKDKWLKE